MPTASAVSVTIVSPSMSPKGVEHNINKLRQDKAHNVSPSMSPKGVEHEPCGRMWGIGSL